jgi:NAD(P)-dependent dehydrogenase (short-subunit alcohol dehydrogenase family)
MSVFVARPEHGVVWISGASSGIGRALALKLAGEGYKVAVTARRHAKLVELQAEARGLDGSIIVLDGDVTNAADMEHTVAAIEYQHGSLGMAILNASVCRPVRGDDMKREDFERSIAVNLNGVVNCLVPAVDLMKTKGHGQIAIVSSMSGYGGLPAGAATGATKAALISMAESLKFDLDRIGIRIQIVNPGFVPGGSAERGRTPAMSPISAQTAADEIAAGLKSPDFEIAFPKDAARKLKLLGLLPYSLYFRAVSRFMGLGDRRLPGNRHSAPHPAE